MIRNAFSLCRVAKQGLSRCRVFSPAGKNPIYRYQLQATGIRCFSSETALSNTTVDTATAGTAQSAEALSDLLVSPVAELGYWPKDLIMASIENLHQIGGLEYWVAIIGATLAVRVLLIPLSIKSMRSTAKMAVMRPIADKLKNAYEANPKYQTDPQMKAQFAEEMKALWKKYDVNPLKSLTLPLAQIPIFVSFFLALRDMPLRFPDMATGGVLWFVDLTAADSSMVLPILNAASFWLMIELGADGMAASQAETMKLAMRGLAVVMIPATMGFSQVKP